MNIKDIYIYIFTAEVRRIKLGQCFPSARLNDWGCSTELLEVFLLETFGTTFWVFSIPRSKRKALCFFKAQVAFPALRFCTLKFASQTTLCFSPFPSAMLFVLRNGMEFLGIKQASCFNKYVVWQILAQLFSLAFGRKTRDV